MDKKEFQTVIDAVFQLMDEIPEIGKPLRDAKLPQRWTFHDVDLQLSATWAGAVEAPCGEHLHWQWETPEWVPDVEFVTDAATAVRFFQGKVNVPIAMATGKLKTHGKVARSLTLIPITRKVHAPYRAWLRDNGHADLVA